MFKTVLKGYKPDCIERNDECMYFSLGSAAAPSKPNG